MSEQNTAVSPTEATDSVESHDAGPTSADVETPRERVVAESAGEGEGSDAGAAQTMDRADRQGAAGTEQESAQTEVGEGGADVRGARQEHLRLLEREGEVAADFLERLLDIADLDGDIDVDVDGDRAAIAIVDSEEGRVPRRLVGPDATVLEALQELTRLAVQASTGERSRLMLDVAGFRAERRAALIEQARVAIAEVRATGESRPMEPMTAFERKVVHDEVLASGLKSESEGTEPSRHVVIVPA